MPIDLPRMTVTPEEHAKLARELADLTKFDWEPRGEVFNGCMGEFWNLWYEKERVLDLGGDCSEMIRKDRRWSTFLVTQILGFMKFFNESLPEDHLDNFHMERERRRFGNLNFDPASVVRLLVPGAFVERSRRDCTEFAERARMCGS